MSLWDGVKKIVGGAAPLVGTLVGGPFGAVAGSLISKALGEDANIDMTDPNSVALALQNDPGAVRRLKQLELENQTTLQMASIQAETARQAEINKTIRSEIASNDAYVRRWRPTMGYSVSFTWAIQMILVSVGILVAVICYPSDAPMIIQAIATAISMTMGLWTVAFGILGISVSKRSQDKAVQAGHSPTSLIDGLTTLIRGGKKSNG